MTISKEALIEFLEKQIKEIGTLSAQGHNANGFTTWQTSTARILEQVYGHESSPHKSFNSIKYHSFYNTQHYQFEKSYKDGLNEAKELLQGILKEVKNFGILKKEEVTPKGSPQTINMIQNQSVDIKIENVLQNTLTATQYKKLETILAEKDAKKKSNKLIEFLKKIGETSLIEIVKGLLI